MGDIDLDTDKVNVFVCGLVVGIAERDLVIVVDFVIDFVKGIVVGIPV